MRVAALAFGVLAGLVASLILALGGLDVADDLAGMGERQVQAIRFGLLLIGNLGVFGAALVLAAPLAAAILLAAGAAAWVGAALLTHHTTDLVLVTPPALLIIAGILALIAHLRRPLLVEEDEPQIEIIAPLRAEPEDKPEPEPEEEEVGMPAFATEAPRYEQERRSPLEDNWNPRRRPPPPPRAKPAFRPVEDEYDDDEPSGLSRFALGLSSVLSFGLYAGLAGAALLVAWNLRGIGDDAPAAVVAEAPVVSSSASLPASSSEPAALPSLPAPVSPVLTPAPRQTAETPASSSQLVAAIEPSTEPAFASLPPVESSLAAGALSSSEAPALPEISVEPPAPEPAPIAPVPASVPAAGQPFPRTLPVTLALLRATPAPAPVVVATPRQPVDITGL